MLAHLRRLASLSFIFGLLSLSGAGAAKPPVSLPDLVALVMPSVVSIYSRGAAMHSDQPASMDASFSQPMLSEKIGSGFIIDPTGIIVTNKHVIEGAFKIQVTLTDGTSVEAHLIGQAVGYDLALIKIDVKSPLVVARLGDSDQIRVGDEVIAAGNPLGFDASVSSGIVSALHRDINSSAYDEFIQTDATINHGNSGGPLFNRAGEAVGLNSAIFTLGGGSIGIGFAIPSNDVRFMLDQFRRYGTLRLGWLGVGAQKLTPEISDSLNLANPRGVIVTSIAKDSPAAKAGLQDGDIIQKYGDMPVPDVRTLNRAVAQGVDKSVMLAVWRKGRDEKIKVDITEWPQPQWDTHMAVRAMARTGKMMTAVGLKMDPVTDALRDKYKIPLEGAGLVVTDVAPDSVAANSGLKTGDLVAKIEFDDVTTGADFQKMVWALIDQGKKHVLLFVIRQNERRWMTLNVSG